MSEKLRRSHSKALRMLVVQVRQTKILPFLPFSSLFQAINPVIFSYGPIAILGLTCLIESDSHVPEKVRSSSLEIKV